MLGAAFCAWMVAGLEMSLFVLIHRQMPLSSVHEKMLAELVGRGLGECDNSAVIRAFETESSSRSA